MSGPRMPWWHRWTEPHPSVSGEAARRRVRMAAALLLVLAPVALLAEGFWWAVQPQRPDATDLVTAATALVLVMAYGVVRSPYPRVGIWLVVAGPWAAIVALSHLTAEPAFARDLLYASIVPVLLASLLLDLRMAIAAAVVNLAGITEFLFGPVGGVPLSGDPLNVWLVVATTSMLILVGAGYLARTAANLQTLNGRLQEVERRRVELLNVVAHDLAAPLTPIGLQLDLLRHTTGPSLSLDILERNHEHMHRLIKDLRDLARIEADRLEVDPRPTDLADLVKEATDAFHAAATARHVRADVDIHPPLPVRADRDRVHQVLTNLLTNALRFSPDGARVAVTATRENGTAVVSVRDWGRGLDADEVTRLFKPFSQVHERSEVQEPGTGLGLYIAKGIIERHGGDIWVESAGRGMGSAFRFRMPIDPAAA